MKIRTHSGLLGISQALLASIFLSACGGGGSSAPDDPEPANLSRLSGTITASLVAVADSDVNDVSSAPVSNDTAQTAQLIRSPVTIGGYVNEPGTGEAGNSFSSGDDLDAFVGPLLDGQVLSLQIADFDVADLDLFLLDENLDVVAQSIDPVGADRETITVPNDGDFFVVVTAFSGASNYILNIAVAAQAASTMSSDAEFMPGQAIVRFKEKTNPVGILGASNAQLVSGKLSAVSPEPVLVGLADRASNSTPTPLPLGGKISDPEQRERFETLIQIKRLALSPGVEYAEPNYIRRPFFTPNDEHFGLQWHYPAINLPQAWDLTQGDNSVIVAVVDTGVLIGHPDISPQLDPNDPNGFDFISSAANSGDGDGIDDNADDAGDRTGEAPSSFHGTHVAGTIAAATNNGQGVAGVAFNTRIMPLRALGPGGGSSFDIQQAVRYAAGLSNSSGRTLAGEQRASVINLSLGGPFSSQSEQDVFDQVRAQGVIVVAAAGNDGNNRTSFPASYDGVVSVASTTITNERARYSQFNSAVDVAAPGGDSSTDVNGDGFGDGVLSTHARDDAAAPEFNFSFQNGTSMAAPHVAGVAALMKTVHPGLTPQQFDDLLASGTITNDLGAVGRDDEFGFGLIDARRAVEAAIDLAGGIAPPDNPQPAASPSSLSFGPIFNDLTVEIFNAGSGSLRVLATSTNQPWLSVVAQSVDANGLGRYQVSVNRTGLPDGIFQGIVTVTTDDGDLEISVSMQVGGEEDANAGLQFVLLLELDTNAVQEFAAPVDEGEYVFEFPEVPDGRYLLISTSDFDNDFLVCDAGESCGAFVTTDQPEEIIVNGEDISGLDFTTGFEASLSSSSRSLSIQRARNRDSEFAVGPK